MLVISRKKGEAFLVGNKVKISIVDIRGDKVRIGIVAPKNVTVLREELTASSKQSKPDTVGELLPDTGRFFGRSG